MGPRMCGEGHGIVDRCDHGLLKLTMAGKAVQDAHRTTGRGVGRWDSCWRDSDGVGYAAAVRGRSTGRAGRSTGAGPHHLLRRCRPCNVGCFGPLHGAILMLECVCERDHDYTVQRCAEALLAVGTLASPARTRNQRCGARHRLGGAHDLGVAGEMERRGSHQ